jgi:hypothetical protein
MSKVTGSMRSLFAELGSLELDEQLAELLITLSLACVKRSQVTEDAGRGDCGAGARIGVSDDAGSVVAGRWRVPVTRGTVTSALTGCWIAFPPRRQG